MKVLVATTETQGLAPGDYCFTVDGELVTPVTVDCSRPEDCGCSRGFPGLASDRATTTAKVVDRPDLPRHQVAMAIRDSLDRAGWTRRLPPDDVADLVEDHLEAIDHLCEFFGPGAVLGRSGEQVVERLVRR